MINKYSLVFIISLLAVVASFGQTETITIDLTSAGGSINLNSSNYDGGTERIWTQNSIDFGGKGITSGTGSYLGSIQTLASKGVLYNTSPLPGRLISVVITSWSGSIDRASTLHGGETVRLVNSTTGNYAIDGSATDLGASTPGSWTTNPATNYTYFAIKRGTSAAYWSQIEITYEAVPTGPTITVSPTSLTGLNYVFSYGPSASQSYDLSGSSLTPASGNITVTAPTNFSISKTLGGTYSSTLNYAYSGGALSAQDVFVRLDDGLPIATYGSVNITNSGGGATAKNVAVEGIVRDLSSNCGSESFNNSNASATYANGSFTGDNGVTWTYVASRDEDADSNGSGINGNALMLRRSSDDSKITSSSVPGGIGDFSVKLYKGFTGNGNRQVELFVNGVSKGTSTPFNDYDEHIFTVTGININNNVIVEIRNMTSRQVIIDSIEWSCYSACIPPADPIGTISGTTPACVTTSLSYTYGTGEPLSGTTYYWQTSAFGTDLTDSAASAYSATSTGTYYVRAYDAALTCWSTNSVSYAVVINTPPNIDTQPVDETINEGDNANFSVISSDATSFLWEEFDGTSWSTIGTGANLTLTAVPVSKDGYQYRVTLSSGNGCGTTVSNVVTLTVLTAACVDEGFIGNPVTTPAGWTFISIGTYTGAGNYGNALPSLQFNATNDRVITKTFTNAIELSFWIKGQSTNSVSALLIEGYDGGSWITVDNITNSIPTIGTVYTYNATSIPTLPSNIQQFRFTYTKSAGNLAFDDVRIYCGTPISGPEINVTGNNLPIPDGSTSPSTGNNTNFGSTLVGNSIVKNFKIQNLGSTDLILTLPITLTDVSAPQEFTITQPGISVITPGNSTTFTVTFNSAVGGLFTNTLNIVSNDADENPYNFDIIATATTPLPPGTIYNPGELIFVGYDGQINGEYAEDEYLIATLVDMVQGTKFSVVNSRYEAGAPANVRTNKWGGGGNIAAQRPYQAVLTYKGTAVIPAGSILRFVTNNTNRWYASVQKIVGTTITNITSSFTGALAVTFDTPNVSTTGSDQIFLMQGEFVFDGSNTPEEANYFLNGTLLHGLTNRAAWVPLSNPCNGDATGDNTRESRLPSALNCFNVENISVAAVSGFYKNDKEHGLATVRDIVVAVSDVSNNWTLGAGRYDFDPSSNLSTSAGKTFLIGPNNPPGQWVGNVNTNWFNCANWEGLKVPDPTTDVSIGTSAVNNAVINYLAPYSDDYSDLAACNNLTITGNQIVIAGSLNNKLEVNGDLLIDFPSGVLNMDDGNPVSADGELFLRGNWTNKVGTTAFEEGNGTVFFQGTTTQLINNYIPIPVRPTEEFYNVILANNLNTSTSNDLHVKGNLTIQTGKQLTVTDGRYVHVNNNLNNDGTFDILNNGSLIQVKDTGVNLGNISMERSALIKRQDYVYWSSPVDGFSVDAVSAGTPSTHIYRWNTVISNPNGGQGNWERSNGELMAQGVGYIIRGPSSYNDTAAPYMAIFNNGIPRNGIIDVPIYKGSYTGGGYAGANGVTITRYDDNWNLVGNPYPSAINAITFLELNTNLDGYVYLWTHQTLPDTGNTASFYQNFAYNYEPGDYIKYNNMGTASGPTGFNGFIGAGQSFMINMADRNSVISPGTVRFQNSLRNKTNDNSQFYRTASGVSPIITADSHLEKHRIWIDLISETTGNSRILVGYAEGATNERDRMYDAVTDLSGGKGFYSVLEDEAFDIQGRALPFQDNDEIPLGIKLIADGSYQIAIAAVDGIFETEEQAIYLKDLFLNITYDLRAQPYAFSSEAGIFNDRFSLVFVPPTLSMLDTEIPANGLTIFELPNGQVKFSVGEAFSIQSVEIMDMLGRTLYHLEGNSATETYSLDRMSQAAYIAKVTLSNGQMIIKRAIKRY